MACCLALAFSLVSLLSFSLCEGKEKKKKQEGRTEQAVRCEGCIIVRIIRRGEREKEEQWFFFSLFPALCLYLISFFFGFYRI